MGPARAGDRNGSCRPQGLARRRCGLPPLTEERSLQMSLQIESPAFKDGQPIPRQYAASGDNLSPPLHFSDLPPGTKELALIVDDPDAPRDEPFTHWVIYKIPATMADLPEGVGHRVQPGLLGPVVQGRNDAHTNGYFGPKPPAGDGPHHYHFHLYALDQELQPQPHHNKQSLKVAMAGHVLGEADLTGVFER
jgi:Raf kinase inhibitor-like YbhB/YbcL family protein